MLCNIKRKISNRNIEQIIKAFLLPTTDDSEDRKPEVRLPLIVSKEVNKANNATWVSKCRDVDRLMGGSRSVENNCKYTKKT